MLDFIDGFEISKQFFTQLSANVKLMRRKLYFYLQKLRNPPKTHFDFELQL